MSGTTFSKNDYRFWETQVFQPKFHVGLKEKTSGYFAVRFQAHRERRKVSLRQTKRRAAGKAALELFKLVEVHGWEHGLAEFRGDLPKPKSGITLGEWLNEVATTGLIQPRTFATYACKVRRIASDLGQVNLPKGMSKHDHVHGGAQEWRKRVERLPIDQLNTKALSEWRSSCLSPLRENPAKLKSAITSTNTCIRAGKAIFAKRIVAFLKHVTPPDPVPFSEIEINKERPTPYRSEIPDPEVLLVAGRRELAETTWQTEWELVWKSKGGTGQAPEAKPSEKINAEKAASRKREAFKSLILGLCAGLRRGEIDRLQWNQVNLSKPSVVIEATDCFAPKANSHGEIPIDSYIAELLRSWKAQSTDRFVVAGVAPRMNTVTYHYRANRAHQALVHWLRSKGVTARTPLHSLRKEYGSIVCQKAGIFVASRLLRHANITMTAAVYTDDRGRVTAGLGATLAATGTDG